MTTTADVMRLAHITYRQADYWVRVGWLRVPAVGSGQHRDWSLDEVAVACRMGAFVEVGFGPARAAEMARR